ncbi:MAG: beta-propeller fold lactonase family protein [Chitinophagaceae bacterium]
MKRLNTLVVAAVSLVGLASCQKETQSVNKNDDGIMGMTQNNNTNARVSEGTGQGAVYLLDNATVSNHVLVYDRSVNGELSANGSFATGGTGTGAGLGSQGAVILDNGNQYLFAVNAGSNDISSFRINGNGLTWVDKIASGGTTPISLTLNDGVIYVLNAGGTGNIHGFRVDQGHFMSIGGSTQSLSSGAAGPAEVQFNNEGTALVVTEKNTNTVDVFPVNNGVAGARVSYPSTGITPFGFAFDKNDQFFVSDAYGGMTGQSALTSYSLNDLGQLAVLSGPVGTTQTSACWVAVTGNGKYAYTANTGSATISGYSINSNGEVSLLDPSGVSGNTGMSPADLALSNNSHFLYSRNGASNSISLFEVQSSGALINIGTVTGLPRGSAGLAAK